MTNRILVSLAAAAALTSAAYAQTATPDTTTTPPSVTTPVVPGSPTTQSGATPAPAAGSEATGTEAATPDAMTAPDTGTAAADPAPKMDGATAAVIVPRLGADQFMASNVVGASARNGTGDTIGDVNDIILGKDGKVAAVVIGVGGFLGIGEKNVAVAYPNFEVTKDGNGDSWVVVQLSKDQLMSAPSYDKSAS